MDKFILLLAFHWLLFLPMTVVLTRRRQRLGRRLVLIPLSLFPPPLLRIGDLLLSLEPHQLSLDVVPEGSLNDDHRPDVDLDPPLDTDGHPG